MQALNLLTEVVPLSLLSKFVPRDVMSVFYHSFADRPIPHIAPLFPCKSAAAFEQDLLYLKTHFRPVSHDDVVAHRENRRKLPREPSR